MKRKPNHVPKGTLNKSVKSKSHASSDAKQPKKLARKKSSKQSPGKPITSVPHKASDSNGPTTCGQPLQGSRVILHDVELWPEPVNGAEVLSEISEMSSSYVVLPGGAA